MQQTAAATTTTPPTTTNTNNNNLATFLDRIFSNVNVSSNGGGIDGRGRVTYVRTCN